MITSIIAILCLIIPSMIFGYCIRWMQEQKQIESKTKSNKQENILPSIDSNYPIYK